MLWRYTCDLRNRIVACEVFFVPSDVDLWLSITRAFQESIQYGIVTFFSLPFWLRRELRRELRGKLFASLRSRDVHREMGLSLSRRLESTKHPSDLCLIFEFCLKVSSMFRKYSIQRLSSSMSYSCGTVLREWFRKSRCTPCFPSCRSFPSTPRWIGWTRDLASGLISNLLDLDSSWVNFWTGSLRMWSCSWTAEWGNPSILKSISPRQVSLYVPPPQLSLCLLEWSNDVLVSELVVSWRP